MSTIIYYISFIILRGLSFLPLPLLYLLSDLLWPLFYYIFRYRRSTVYKNLKNSFPTWDEKTIRQTEIRFYRHFTDVMMETIKTIDLTPGQIRKRIYLRNPQLMHDLYQQKKNIILVASHYANWEWLMGLAGATPYHTLAVYKPLHNKRIDKIMKDLRSKAGTELVSMRWILKTLSNYNRENKLTFSLFVADQSPVREEAEYWTTFLNQDTAVFVGIEKLAIRYNHAVLFCYTRRIRRGYYEVDLKPVSLDPSATKPHEITNRHLQLLEELIREDPAYWLWSHRRWKLKKLPVDNSHAN